MAIAQVGSTLQFGLSDILNTGTVSTAITVPSGTELVIVGVSGWTAVSNGMETMTFTKGGVDTAMTRGVGGDVATTWQGAQFYLVEPDIGTNKTLKWDWIGTGSSGASAFNFMVTFWSGIDTADPVRDSDGAQATSLALNTPSLTAASGDKIVAMAAFYHDDANGGGSIDTWSNVTEVAEVAPFAYAELAWATGDPTGNTTVGISTATATSGEFSITALVLKPASAGYTLAADGGSYAVTGTAASLEMGREVAADAGSYAVTGQAASLEHNYEITATGGSYSVTGSSADVVREFIVLGGSYAITGSTAALEHGREVVAGSGSYAVTGSDATLTLAASSTYTLAADGGAYAVTGSSASLEVDREVTADGGSYTVNGSDVVIDIRAARSGRGDDAPPPGKVRQRRKYRYETARQLEEILFPEAAPEPEAPKPTAKRVTAIVKAVAPSAAKPVAEFVRREVKQAYQPGIALQELITAVQEITERAREIERANDEDDDEFILLMAA
jgi:hypothetical protein